MAYVAVPLDAGLAGVDTVFQFTPHSAARLAAARVCGKTPSFVWRYASLGKPSPADATAAEVAAITGAGLAVLLVQHAHGPEGHPWQASAAQGHADAAAAIGHAKAIGYLPGCSLAFDLEDCRSVGQPVIDHVTAWANDVRAAGYSPVLYVGYACGLTPVQLSALPFDAYWSDAAPRSVAPKFFSCKQRQQGSVAGIGIDPDEVLGPGLVAMVDAGPWGILAPDPGDPVARDTEPAGPPEAA